MENPMVDERSGFCKSNSVFYSKRKPLVLPQNNSIDVTTFVSSRPHSGTIAFIDAATGRHVMFPELWRAVDSVAECLFDMGIRKGDVILILSPNSVAFPIVCLAIMSLGGVITTTNPVNTPREIAKQIADSHPVLAFTTSHLVAKIFDSSPDLPLVLMDDDDVLQSPRIVSTLNSMMRREPSERRVRHRVDQDDTATLLYSSGTTGVSKGVVSSHRNMIAMVQTIITRSSGREDEEHTFLCTIPMFHIYGLAAAISLLCWGAKVVVLSRFEIDDMLSAIETYKATYLPLVPPIMLVMMNGAESMKARYNLTSIRSVSSSGAPLSKEVIEGFVEKFPGVEILQGYGLTETTGTGSSTDSLEESRVYGTAGLLSPSMEAKIVDPESGEALAVNKTGELWLKGPGIMKDMENPTVDDRSRFCKSSGVYYSKRNPLPLPPNHSLDVTTFISSRAHCGKIAFVDAATGRHLTFPELWRSVDSVAACLSDMGIRKGDVILLLSPNSISFPLVCFAVMSLGAVITTTNTLNTPREIAKQIADSRPVLAFTTSRLVAKIIDSSPDLPVILIDVDDDVLQNPRIVSTLSNMMRTEPSERQVRYRVDQDDTATLLYSSGTTGASKGVVSSHKNLIAMVQMILSRFSAEEGEHTFLCTVPMFHIYGLAGGIGLLGTGSTMVVLSQFEIDDMLSAIERYRVTYLPLVPPILVTLLNGAERMKARYDLRSLRSVLCGGAPLSKEVIEGFLEKFPGIKIMQGYGLTESNGFGASTDSMEESRVYGTAGLLSPSTEAKIVDPDSGEALPVKKAGELWLKGPGVMKGYFSNQEATSLTIDSEGWLRTGDLCYIDDDGFIFVVDRLKELIKYKGYQVPPAELEALLISHLQISDAAVIPYPDKDVGQYPMAYIVRKAGSNLSETDVMDFIAKLVAPYKKIRKVAFIGSIPKNPSGKILRKDLIKLATSKL